MQNAPISLNSYLRVYSQKLPYQKHITCMCHKSNIIPKHFENLTYISLNFLNILTQTPLWHMPVGFCKNVNIDHVMIWKLTSDQRQYWSSNLATNIMLIIINQYVNCHMRLIILSIFLGWHWKKLHWWWSKVWLINVDQHWSYSCVFAWKVKYSFIIFDKTWSTMIFNDSLKSILIISW